MTDIERDAAYGKAYLQNSSINIAIFCEHEELSNWVRENVNNRLGNQMREQMRKALDDYYNVANTVLDLMMRSK